MQKAWHPSTLLSKECYGDYTESFASMILDFAKQTEEIHGTANSDMKVNSLESQECRFPALMLLFTLMVNVKLYDFLLQQVILQPAIFKSVNFTSYTNGWLLFFMPQFMLYSFLNDILLIELMLACSFEGTEIHHKGRELGYKHQTREQAGYVLL